MALTLYLLQCKPDLVGLHLANAERCFLIIYDCFGLKNLAAMQINYKHKNPVEEGLVFRPEDNLYSSACDYAGEKGC